MNSRRFFSHFLTFLFLFSLLLATACQPATPKAGDGPTTAPPTSQAPALNRDPKTLVVATYSTMRDFDPASNNEQQGNVILEATTEGLVRVNPDNIEEFVPQLAERWEHNQDNTQWTFYLRKNAKFHDGTPVNAEAVKYSFKRLIDSKLGMSFILGQFMSDPEKQMTVKDDYTIQFDFDTPTPLLIKALSSSFGAYVISPTAAQAHDKDGDMGHEWLQNNDAGSGAYVISENQPNQQLVLTKFNDWWGWKSDGWYFDKIIIKVVPEEASRRTLIEKGDVDIAVQFGPENWDALKKNPDISVQLAPGLALQYVVLGDYGPLKDPKVRQAISYAFDYKGYVDGIMKGYAPQAHGPLPSKLLCHDPNAFVYTTDLAKAKQLLNEAGIQPGTQITYLTEEGGSMAIGTILQAQLAQVGINVKVEQRDTSSMISIFYGDQEWPDRPELFSWTWWPDYNDPTDWAWILFHTDAKGSAGANAGFYNNARADEIMNLAPGIEDQTELCTLYKEFQDIVVRQDPAWIPLVESPDEAILRKDIAGYKSNPLYRGTFNFYQLSRTSN